MAITFVNAGTGDGGTGTVTPGMPAGATTDDLLILVIEGEGEDANADSPPTGGDWNTIGSVASAEDGAVDRTRASIYWAWYSSGINRVVPDAGDHTIAIIYAFSGVNKTTPIDASSTSGSNATNDTSHTAATGLSSVTDGAMAVLAYTHGDGTGTVPASWANANLVSANSGGAFQDNSGSDGTVDVIYGIKTSLGAIGSFTWGTSASEENAWWAIVLRPAVELAQVNKDLQAVWDLRELVNKDLQVQFDIFVLVLKDIQSKYDIFNSVDKDLQAQWDIRELVNKDMQAVWDMSGAVSKDIQAQWDIFNLVNKDTQALWDILNVINKDLQSKWDIAELVNKDLQAIWDMSGAVNKDLQAKWDLAQLVNKDVEAKWDIFSIIGKELQAIWDIFNSVSKDIQSVWDILGAATVFKDLQSKWDILGEGVTDAAGRIKNFFIGFFR